MVLFFECICTIVPAPVDMILQATPIPVLRLVVFPPTLISMVEELFSLFCIYIPDCVGVWDFYIVPLQSTPFEIHLTSSSLNNLIFNPF